MSGFAFTERQRAFLDRPHSAVIATLRQEGPPSMSVVWFMRDGDTIWVSVGHESVKARHLRRDARVSILVLSPDGGAYLQIEGVATTDERVDPDRRLRLIGKYVGAERAPAWVASHPLPHPNLLVRIHPDRVYECLADQ